jgi:hypothetical protein
MIKAVLVLPAGAICKDKVSSLTRYLLKKKFFKKGITARLYTFLNRKCFANCLVEIPLGDIGICYALSLPFNEEEINFFNNKVLAEEIEKSCSGLGNYRIHLPQSINNIVVTPICNDSFIYGGMLFKAVLDLFIQELFENNSIKINNLASLIVLGEDSQELLHYLTMLEPWLKFITVLVKDDGQHEWLEEKITPFVKETGLSVIIETDIKKSIKNADLVINLADLENLPQIRAGGKKLIFNVSNPQQANRKKQMEMPDEWLVINDLEFVLAEEIIRSFPAAAIKHFGKETLSKIVLFSKQAEYNTQIRENFGKYSCKFTAVTGRRGRIDIESVKQHIA